MRSLLNRAALAAVLAGGLGLGAAASANTTITTFDNFLLDGQFASWAPVIPNSGPTSFSLTSAGGYGSGYKDINPNINATGETTIELTITLAAPAAGPIAGPIVSLVDGDGTFWNYAWFGQENGSFVLTAPLSSPSFVSSAGAVAGLDLSTLDFFHLQDDPGGYGGPYTITFENLRLTGAVPEPASLALAACGLIGGLGVMRRRFAV